MSKWKKTKRQAEEDKTTDERKPKSREKINTIWQNTIWKTDVKRKKKKHQRKKKTHPRKNTKIKLTGDGLWKNTRRKKTKTRQRT
jgi:hypothetical protein